LARRPTSRAASLRAYEAALILRAGDFEHAKVLDGSLAVWPYELELKAEG